MEGCNLKEASCTYHMIGGDGPNSYAQNSEYQKHLVVSSEELIHELINKHLDLENPPFDPQTTTFRIADFGCSTGPNTFLAIENIISAIQNKYQNKNPNYDHHHHHFIPEFQIFFNDLIDNDFNTLFKNLPLSRKYFVSAVPGSFHGRLFPQSSLHFAHCSTALHWLSRIPEQVTKRDLNKGKIHYSGAGKEVEEAYADQYKEDMEVFLNARGQEVVDGGLMVLVIIGFPDGVLCSESSIGGAFDILGSSLKDLANMGKISEEKVASFNLPFYYPSPSELKSLMDSNGLFNIETIVELSAPMRRNPDPQVLTSHMRAVIGGLIEEHFGNTILLDELFRVFLEKFAKSPLLYDDKYWKEINYFVFLKRKPTIKQV